MSLHMHHWLMHLRQLDYDLVDYVGQLREGILEAYTGIVTGLKSTAKGSHHCLCMNVLSLTTRAASLLLNHAQSILDLVQRCLADEERSDALMRLSYGLIGDLAESFAGGQLKQLFLQPWLAAELRSRSRMPDETKKTMRWAREVSLSALASFTPT